MTSSSQRNVGLPRPDALSSVRFFVDENLAGLGLALRRVRPFPDVVVASHDPIAHLIPRDDPDWIPAVAGRRWVVITNDRHIRTRFAADPRENRIQQARAVRRGRPSGAERRGRRRALGGAQPGQLSLPDDPDVTNDG